MEDLADSAEADTSNPITGNRFKLKFIFEFAHISIYTFEYF